MLHPTLARALATAHIEDLQRAAAGRHTIRLARHVVSKPSAKRPPIDGQRLPSAPLREFRAPRPGA
ncbi:MAG TPA: hypothetical protein VMB27_26295 [Solirubrobacteraceae bacterium]|nr:hypothetical protein [Solirubrobacteraceae bacterium]